MTNIKVASALYTIGSILAASINFIFIPIFIAEFTVHDYGVYSLILVCNAVAAAIFYLGVTSALNRSFFDYSDQKSRNDCFYTTLLLLCVGALAQVLVGYFFSDMISVALFSTKNWSNSVFIGLASSAVSFINYSFLTYFRLVNKPYHFFVSSLFSVLINVLCIYYFVLINNQGVEGAIKGPFIAQALLLIIFSLHFKKIIKESKFLMNECHLQLKLGFQHVLSSLGALTILWSDQFFVNKYLSLTDVGIYSLAVKLASVITVGFSAPFIQVFHPIIMEQRKNKSAKTIIEKSYLFYITSGFLLAVITSLIAEEFILYFDKDGGYKNSIIFIYPLIISALIYGIINIVSIGLVFERKLGRQSLVFFVFSLINLLLNYLLIPYYGVWGAVSSTLLTYMFIAFALLVISNKLYKVDYPKKFTLIIFSLILIFFPLQVSFISVGDDITRYLIKFTIVSLSFVVLIMYTKLLFYSKK